MHFLQGDRISTATRPLVELTCLMEAGTFISGLGLIKNEVRWPKMRAKYVRCVSDFGLEDFQSLAIRDKMQTHMYRAQGALDGKRLWERFGEFRSELRKMTSFFPPGLASMPSGNQLHDTYQRYLVERYRTLYVSVLQGLSLELPSSLICVSLSCQPDEADGKDDDDIVATWPSKWWLRGNQATITNASNGIRGLLALQVHRTNKEIVADCASQPPGATRAVQRQLKEDDTNMIRAKAKADNQASDSLFRKEKRARLQVVNVAILEKQNDIISKQLALLTANKDVFVRKYNEKAYNDKVVALLGKLPDPVADMMNDAADDSDGTGDLLDPEEADEDTA